MTSYSGLVSRSKSISRLVVLASMDPSLQLTFLYLHGSLVSAIYFCIVSPNTIRVIDWHLNMQP